MVAQNILIVELRENTLVDFRFKRDSHDKELPESEIKNWQEHDGNSEMHMGRGK